MKNFKSAGKIFSVAALAASTTLAGPAAVFAQDAPAQSEELIVPGQAPQAPATAEPTAEAPADSEAEATTEPAAEEEPAAAEEPAAEPAEPAEPAAKDAAPAEPVAETAAPAEEPVAEEPAAEEPAAESAAPAETEATEPVTAPAAEPVTAPAAEPAEPAAPAESAPSTGEASTAPADAETDEAPAQAESAPAAEETTTAPAAAAESTTAPAAGDAATAPAASEAAPAATAGEATAAPSATAETPEPVAAEVQTAPVEPGQISASDARVQKLAEPVTVRPVTEEEGRRVEGRRDRDRREGAEVVERIGDRTIVNLAIAGIAGAAAGGAAALFIESNDDDRLAIDASEQYVEELSGERYRETIVRPNGVQVVTITNRYGDIIQRSRILPDGREVVLFYDPYADEAVQEIAYFDVGAELPPLELAIPEEEYIVALDEPDTEIYYDTIVAPPVETVERIYSVAEVRRSERIRDKVRRIDLNTINFDLGSATVEQSEVENLKALANAISRVIEENPGETFLIEGHTDAVGDEVANLALSDQRAEAVATALTEYFDIPAENLVTQGYGEEDLKVETEAENRENRRVSLRRITALVKPVETATAN